MRTRSSSSAARSRPPPTFRQVSTEPDQRWHDLPRGSADFEGANRIQIAYQERGMRAFLTSGGERDDFDPVVEAAAYGLDGDEARAIWQRIRREASDDATARRRFHQEARAAANLAPRPVVGRRTLVDAEAEEPRAVPRVPGRHSLISFAARQEPVAIHRKAESSVVDAKAADLVAAARMG